MIIATAGHIDHGKTALLQALTGHAGDQRREEQERGITIDLGYRYADLGGQATLGFIDVPGHERFVHNMLAGAAGVDLALLVIAADDGVMPQTREHLAILALLGIARLWVVLSKCDHVDAQRQAAAEAEIKTLLATGPYAGAPIFAVSSTSGDGIAALRQALLAEASHIAQHADHTHFRLSVDRAFSISGSGTVVTGTALSGRVTVGDNLLLVDAKGAHQTVRVRGLHAQNCVTETAQAGQRVALNLAGDRLKAQHVHRGNWLLPAALLNPSRRLDIHISLLPDAARALEHWTPVHVHLGAQRLTGRVALLDETRLVPGGSALAQLVLDETTQAIYGDRVVLRDQSAWHTLGGGLEVALPTLLSSADNGLAPATLECKFNRPQQGWLLPQGTLTQKTSSGPRLFTEALWQQHRLTLTEALTRFHQEQPDESGPDRSRLRRYGLPHLEPAVFSAVLDEALSDASVASSGPWLHMPEYQVRLSETEETLKAQLWPHLEAGGINPPWVRDLAQLESLDESSVRALLLKLARLGQLHQVVRDLFYPEPTIEHLAECAMRLAENDIALEVVAFRDALGLGRKRCVQLLEYLDRLGVTRRFGNQRRIREESSMVLRIKTR